MYKNLKAFRESIGITQKDFAASLGIGLTTYNGYETGLLLIKNMALPLII